MKRSLDASAGYSRREWLQRMAFAPLAAALPTSLVAKQSGSLPAAGEFAYEGTYLNAAFTHPMSLRTAAAMKAYTDRRLTVNQAADDLMGTNRTAAARLFAQMIHAQPEDLAWVPSTMAGENFVVAGLGLPGTGQRVVTDAYHFHGSLYLYGQLSRQGLDVVTVRPRNNVIDIDDLDKAITRGTKLVAISLVSATTGFQHDLKAVCERAHAKGALVYADIIQAAGAVPIDVKDSGVDFCSCSAYKWLMADFGAGFLYVRKDRLPLMKRTQYGYRQIAQSATHVLPFDLPGDKVFDWQSHDDAGGMFQVGTLSNSTIAALRESLEYITANGVNQIQAWRQPLLRKLQEKLPSYGYLPMTPTNSSSPILAFALEHAEERLRKKLDDAQVNISLYPNRIRISPSVYNTMDDVEKLISVLAQV